MTEQPGGWGYTQALDEVRAEDEAQRVRPNGHTEDWRALPAIDPADVARWRDRIPAEIIFTIEDLVPLGMVTLLTSVGGAGKTLLMQMATTAIASGNLSFLGKRCLIGKAAGVFAEDPETMLHLRQTRINDQWGLEYDRIVGRLFLQSYFGLPTQLWRQGKPTDFMEQLEAQLKRIEGLRLLTLDNAALLYSGDENNRPEVTEFLSVLNGLAHRLDIGIVLSAHASK
jgi:RecA-family ATPase